MSDMELSSEEEDTVSLQILRQLKKVNDRLDAVEEKVADVVTGDLGGQLRKCQKDRKLSKHSNYRVDKKNKDKK